MSKFEIHYPLKPSICTQKFGLNDVDYMKLLGLKGHPGEDWANIDNPENWPNNPAAVNNSYGRNIRAAHDGKVTSLEQDTNGGYTVVLVTNQQFDYNGGQTYFKTVYAHCIADSFKVKVGDQVRVGDILASCGATGVYPGDPAPHPEKAHVHFAVKPVYWRTTNADGTPAQYGYWSNTEQMNGYGGAISNSEYWSGMYALDFRMEQDTIAAAASAVSAVANAPISNQQKLTLWEQIKVVLINLLKAIRK